MVVIHEPVLEISCGQKQCAQTDRQTDRHTPMTTRPCGLRRAGNDYRYVELKWADENREGWRQRKDVKNLLCQLAAGSLLSLAVFDLGPMYATDVRRASSFMCPYPKGGTAGA